MSLQCSNKIVSSNLAIHIDLTNLNSWNLNSGFTSISLTKWFNAISDNINLYDFGLTAFDNGRTNKMYDNFIVNPNNNKLTLYRVGYNSVLNPISGGTSGATGTTLYDLYQISAVTNTNVGSYFSLFGGYLQGYFKLHDYNYELLPSRYNDGITIETLLQISSNSEGIFYLMGTRAEDKYNNYFSGETTLLGETSVSYGNNQTGNLNSYSGVVTSENNFLNSIVVEDVIKTAFSEPEFNTTGIDVITPQNSNIGNNVIAFEITLDKRIGYKYVDSNGLIRSNYSDATIPVLGWSLISITFTPDYKIQNYDTDIVNCYQRRTGTLIFYVNGRVFWKIPSFDEFYFKELRNDREKQIGVPYNISWGGGSFGLKHSWHYDNNIYDLYNGEDDTYINSKFFVTYNPIVVDCAPTGTTNTYQSGLTVSANTTTFTVTDICNPEIQIPETVMQITSTGGTGTTYFIKFNQPLELLSNRTYEISLDMFDTGIFNSNSNTNTISLLVYGDIEIETISETIYQHPNIVSNNAITTFITGINEWKNLKLNVKLNENTGKQIVYVGLLIKSDLVLTTLPLYVNNFKYSGADKYSQDSTKNNLLIEQNFDSSFIGGIQKLRVYDRALNGMEVLNNAVVESKLRPALLLRISNGGRIINRYQDPIYIPQESAGSDIRKSIRYRNNNGTYKDLYQMIDIYVVVKSRNNPNVELVKFKKNADIGWLALIYINNTTYDFIVPDTVTTLVPNETLFAEIKFMWTDENDIDNVFEKIFVVDITTTNLLDNTVRNY